MQFSKCLCGVHSPIPAISCIVLWLLVQWHLIFFCAFFTPDIFHLSKQKEAQVEFITLMATFHLGELLPGFWCCACSLTDVASYWETLNRMEPSLTLLVCAFYRFDKPKCLLWIYCGTMDSTKHLRKAFVFAAFIYFVTTTALEKMPPLK